MLTDNLYLLRLLRYNRPSYLWIKEENKQLDLKKKKKKKGALRGSTFRIFSYLEGIPIFQLFIQF